MKLGRRTIASDAPPYVIAEIGVNHDGDRDRARTLITAAAEAGADAVKFQWFDPACLLSADAALAGYQRGAGAADARSLLTPLALDADALDALAGDAHAAGLAAVVTVFSAAHVERAARGPWDGFKIASPDLVHRPLLQAWRTATDRPLLISTGAATQDEVRDAVAALGNHPHVLFQCVSMYPTPDDDAALDARRALATLDPWALGYSDHTRAEDTGALAVATGARVLEKHLTYDRSASGPDHAMALEPDAFARYVRGAHRAWRMCGVTEKTVAPGERDVRRAARQSVCTTRALPEGHVLQPGDLTVKRPGTGLPPSALDAAAGRTLARALEMDRVVREQDLA